MSQRIREDFEQYAVSVVEALRQKAQLERRGPVRLISHPDREVRDAVALLEDDQPFGELVATTRRAFHSKPSRRDESMWRHSVQSFFRRSGFYLRAAAGQAPPVDVVFAQYVGAFQSQQRRLTYLAPIEHVYCARAQLDFGSFTVRRFSRDELATLLETSINRVFYEWALTEVRPLDDYWYVSLTKTLERRQPGEIRVNLADIEKVTPTFTSFPQVEEALLPLVSFPWQADLWRHEPREKQEYWHGFRIPFLIVVDEDLLRPPRSRPDIARLDREPDSDSTTGEERDTERPVIWTHLDTQETNTCEAFVRAIGDHVSLLATQSIDWQFFERARSYLLKGFFADGLEQLLWHITTVDALLGEDAPGAGTKRLARRVAAILGTTAKEQDTIRGAFFELYHFRSRFVHGGPLEKHTLTKHLREAREIARTVLVWFVAFLTHMQDVARREQLPAFSRNDLLALIDLNVKAKAELATILKASDALPDGFPSVPSWLASTPPQRTGIAGR